MKTINKPWMSFTYEYDPKYFSEQRLVESKMNGDPSSPLCQLVYQEYQKIKHEHYCSTITEIEMISLIELMYSMTMYNCMKYFI